VVLWRIYYDDESVITNEDMSWEDTPTYGILFVKQYSSDNQSQIHMGSDYYLMRNNTVISFNPIDLQQHLVLGITKGAIKFGRWCPDDVWKRVHKKIFGK
jgi:hypothetical protein